LSPRAVYRPGARFLDFFDRGSTPAAQRRSDGTSASGLDIHKETVVACVRHLRNGKVMTGIKTFKTTTEELIALSDWLTTEGCTHIVMEATGVYWKPV
jgi:hypothetical protein